MSPLPNRRPPSYSAKMRRDELPPILPSCRSCCASPDCRGSPAMAARRHTHRAVENRWKSSGKHVGEAKKAWRGIYLVAPRRRTRSVLVCRYGSVLQILQNGFGQALFLVQTVLLSEPCSTRFER